MSMRHLLRIASNHLWDLGPILFSLSTKTSSLPAALLSLVMPLFYFLYFSLLKGYTMLVYPSAAGSGTGRFDVGGMLSLPLTRGWCATWCTLTRHGGMDVVESFDSFLIVFHVLRLLCNFGEHDDFLPSPFTFLRHSVNQFVSRF